MGSHLTGFDTRMGISTGRKPPNNHNIWYIGGSGPDLGFSTMGRNKNPQIEAPPLGFSTELLKKGPWGLLIKGLLAVNKVIKMLTVMPAERV